MSAIDIARSRSIEGSRQKVWSVFCPNNKQGQIAGPLTLPTQFDPRTMAEEQEEPKFGSPTPFAEPSWYDPRNSTPYYTEHHKKFRATLREFVDKDVNPHVEEWEAAGEIPIEVYRKAGQIGLLQAAIGWPSIPIFACTAK